MGAPLDALAELLQNLHKADPERMARAAEQGYDTSNIYLHGTRNNIKEFNPNVSLDEDLGFKHESRGATTFTQNVDEANDYAFGDFSGGNRKAKFLVDADDNLFQMPKNYNESKFDEYMKLRDKYGVTGLSPLTNLKDYSNANSKIWDKFASKDPELQKIMFNTKMTETGGNVVPVFLNKQNLYDPSENDLVRAKTWLGFEKPKVQQALADAGYDSYIAKENNGDMNIGMMDPSKIRSIFANFDPKKINSKDLLASLAAPAAAGIGVSALSPDDANAFPAKPLESVWHNGMEIIKNPNQKILNKIAQNDVYGGVRTIKDFDSGDVYAWPASLKTHDDVAKELNIPYVDDDTVDSFYLKDGKLRSSKIDTGEDFGDDTEDAFKQQLKKFAPYAVAGAASSLSIPQRAEAAILGDVSNQANQSVHDIAGMGDTSLSALQRAMSGLSGAAGMLGIPEIALLHPFINEAADSNLGGQTQVGKLGNYGG